MLGDGFLVKIQFELQILVAVTVTDMEITVKHPSHEVIRIFAQTDAEFFKDSYQKILLTGQKKRKVYLHFHTTRTVLTSVARTPRLSISVSWAGPRPRF